MALDPSYSLQQVSHRSTPVRLVNDSPARPYSHKLPFRTLSSMSPVSLSEAPCIPELLKSFIMYMMKFVICSMCVRQCPNVYNLNLSPLCRNHPPLTLPRCLCVVFPSSQLGNALEHTLPEQPDDLGDLRGGDDVCLSHDGSATDPWAMMMTTHRSDDDCITGFTVNRPGQTHDQQPVLKCSLLDSVCKPRR